MILLENVDYVGWAAVKGLRGFDPEELANLFKSSGIRSVVYKGQLLTEDSRTAERMINVLYDAKHHTKLYLVKQWLRKAGRAILWGFSRLMCCMGNHEWTCDAIEGKKIDPAEMKDLSALLNGYAKMYCKYCKTESVLSRKTREAWKERQAAKKEEQKCL